jgi:diguanylate cyclase (GGDEF)-like protein
MTGGLPVLLALMLVSAMLAVMLGLAWYCFDRPRYAASWSAAFGLAAAQSLLKLTLPEDMLGRTGQMALYSAIAVAIPLLLFAGFAQRCGRHRAWIGTASGAAVVAVVSVTMLASAGATSLAMVVPLFYRAALVLLTTVVVTPPGRRANFTEWTVIAMLGLLALHSIVLGALMLMRMQFGFHGLGGLDRYLLLVGLPAALIGVGMSAVLLLAADLAEKMRELATRDPLTGVLNRRGFEEAAARSLASARRRGAALCAVITDVDRFKAINDRFGHATGDRVLVRLAEFLESSVRANDLVGRLGGEEFAILLSDTDGCSGGEAVERIRQGVEELAQGLDLESGLTASFGVACVTDGDPTFEAVLSRADAALYEAKISGRNRTVVAGASG